MPSLALYAAVEPQWRGSRKTTRRSACQSQLRDGKQYRNGGAVVRLPGDPTTDPAAITESYRFTAMEGQS